ncbi:metallophosphoesterase [Corallococcus sp. AS-1-6]|uniref:metallophosphoesterase n=1 Tax=Corallococcus sp. AS-1-6 TaxID=2874599 RepID=UPI001CC07078|nr:metallophosphoesterase [Corallococcus sp. AS-1-6]MBZ4371018.1 metallophosphoesterase [Corallococcus sp. AS-1-6]
MDRTKSLSLAALAALSVGGFASCDALALPRDPYLQKVGPDTATVAFRLSANCSNALVRYGAGNTSQTARSTAAAKIHAVVLTGLSPATSYTYSVDGCGETTPAKTFSTAPVPGTRRVHFAAVGDFGTGGSDQKKVAASMLTNKPELFVALGDNAYASGTETEFQNNLFTPMAALLSQVPMFATPGNHEYVTNEAQPYLDNLYLPTNNAEGSERYYSFDWGHVHFVSIDSNCAVGLASSSKCTLAAQKAFVEKDLAATTQPWKVVFFHHPSWSSGEHGSQLTMRRQFGPLFEKYGVDLVLTGHDHDYERSKPMLGDAEAGKNEAGIPYLVVGGGGATLRTFATSRPSWSVIRDDAAHGFLDVDVVEGNLTAKLVKTDGGVLDTFTLSKTLPARPEQPQGTLNVAVDSGSGAAPHTASFTATAPQSGATITWDFGDGATAEGPQAQHVFARAGTYTVTATATVQGAAPLTTTTVVTVTASGTTEPGTDPGTGSGSGEDPGTTPSDPDPRPEIPATPTTPGVTPGDGNDSNGGGGCAAGPSAALIPAAAALVAGLVRRRRRDR